LALGRVVRYNMGPVAEAPVDMYEQLVETFLTVIERCAVIPQFPVLFDKQDNIWVEGQPVAWAAYPDFLAIDFVNQQIQVIEVTKSRGTKKTLQLVDRLVGNRKKVERHVREFTRNLDFPIVWRFFVRQDLAVKLRSKLKDKGIEPFEVIDLESVFDRLRKLMP